MSRINPDGFEVARCWECFTELEIHRMSQTESGHYLCPHHAQENQDQYTITEYADEVDPNN